MDACRVGNPRRASPVHHVDRPASCPDRASAAQDSHGAAPAGLLHETVRGDEHLIEVALIEIEFIGRPDGAHEDAVLIEQDAVVFRDNGVDGQAQFIGVVQGEDILRNVPVDPGLLQRQLTVDRPGCVFDRDRPGKTGCIRADDIGPGILPGIDDQVHIQGDQAAHVAEHGPVVPGALREVHRDLRTAGVDVSADDQVRRVADPSADDSALAKFNGGILFENCGCQSAAGRNDDVRKRSDHLGTVHSA